MNIVLITKNESLLKALREDFEKRARDIRVVCFICNNGALYRLKKRPSRRATHPSKVCRLGEIFLVSQNGEWVIDVLKKSGLREDQETINIAFTPPRETAADRWISASNVCSALIERRRQQTTL